MLIFSRFLDMRLDIISEQETPYLDRVFSGKFHTKRNKIVQYLDNPLNISAIFYILPQMWHNKGKH